MEKALLEKENGICALYNYSIIYYRPILRLLMILLLIQLNFLMYKCHKTIIQSLKCLVCHCQFMLIRTSQQRSSREGIKESFACNPTKIIQITDILF